MKNIIKRLLNEALLPESYHITNFDNILDILASNTINLSSSLGSKSDQYGNRFFFLSFSRTKSLKLGYKAGQKNIAVIVFDGNKLNNNFKSLPVDYWETKGITTHSDWSANRYEYEERLISDKPIINNVSKYIIRIDLLFDFKEDSTVNENRINTLQEIIKLGKSRNININIYSNEKDLLLKRDNINDKIINYNIEFGIEKYDSKIKDRYENILALLLFNKEYLDDYNLFEKDFSVFLEKNNLTEDEVSVYDTHAKMRYLLFNRLDFAISLETNLHNFFKMGKGGKYRDLAGVLGKKIKKSRANSVREYIDLILDGKRPELDNSYKKVNYTLYELTYNQDTGKRDTFVKIDTKEKLSELRGLYFASYKYNGYLDEKDMVVFFEYSNKGKTIGNFIDYLFSKYTTEKVKEIILNSGYDEYYEQHLFRLTT
jgi:hypothetical protein